MNVVRKMLLKPHFAKPHVECMVELEIDLERLMSVMGAQAFRNKSKRAIEAHGLLVAKVRLTEQEKTNVVEVDRR